ncbi:MAG TPA: SAM-dependent methyltransferase, partial [Pseudonocardiaceae bacterium]
MSAEPAEPAEADAEPPDPAEFDVTRPNAARMYDYFLGGAHNLAIDRELADKTIAIMPGIVDMARANRSFLRRAVQYCMKAGIRQYLDLGSGIPTVGHVHEVAHRIDRAARVAYVDIEPVAVAQTKRLLADVPTATVTKADITDPKQVLAAPGVAELLDFNQPVAIVACAVLHFVPDSADPVGVLTTYRDHLSPGGALVFSHGASSLAPE